MKAVLLKKSRNSGFTLIELLVVIAIILILAGLLFPAVTAALAKSQGVKVGSDGRMIAIGLFSTRTDRIAQGLGEILPDAAYASTSTQFFQDCITSNYLDNFNVRSFGAPGLTAPANTNVTDLTSANNAWCLTIGYIEGTAEDTPLLFSKNFTGGTTLDKISGLDATTKPFGAKVGVVIMASGSAKVLSGKDLKSLAVTQKLFNPSGSTLGFVRP